MNFSPRMLPDVINRLWDARARGATLGEISEEVGWGRNTVARHVHERGGIRPRCAVRVGALTLDERIEIQALKRARFGVRAIATRLGRSPSTISRELSRNKDAWGRYRATVAQARAWREARRPKESKLSLNPRLRVVVQDWLDLRYSPEQIAGRLRREFPDEPEMHVSPETIYQAIYLIARGDLKRELQQRVRTGRTLRRPRRRAEERRGRIPGMTMIADRPAEADDRTIPGHWEGDLIVGKDGKSAIGTIVERRSGYLLLLHLDPTLPRIDAVTDALGKRLGALPEQLRHTLTWDQGSELHRHHEIAIAADIDIYFCDPHSPWQRPSNENTNGLLRQYFPKSTDLSLFSPEDLDYVEWQMNDRPRKRLDYAKPSEVIHQVLLR